MLAFLLPPHGGDLGPDARVGAVVVDLLEVDLEHRGAGACGEAEREQFAVSVDIYQTLGT